MLKTVNSAVTVSAAYAGKIKRINIIPKGVMNELTGYHWPGKCAGVGKCS
jgi:hypothetical protein